MGSISDAKTAAWQQQVGIDPATGDYADALEKLSQTAFEAIKVIELERSGIRGGDGGWHGSSVIDGVMLDLTASCERVRRIQNREREFARDHGYPVNDEPSPELPRYRR